mmetsp:Transcript_2242/g.3422  ORF Transcript_2242/g.3422 Transcript_2242/m.3422 type:complete len:206 (-) Transcript_2242:308-925(-)
MYPRLHVIVYVVFCRCNVMKEETRKCQLLHRASPRGPTTTSKVNMILVLCRVIQVNIFACNGHSYLLPLSIISTSLCCSFHSFIINIISEFDIHPRYYRERGAISPCPLCIFERQRREHNALPSWHKLGVILFQRSQCSSMLTKFIHRDFATKTKIRGKLSCCNIAVLRLLPVWVNVTQVSEIRSPPHNLRNQFVPIYSQVISVD